MNILDSNLETRRSLVVRIRDANDEQAWSEFVAVYEPVIYRLVRRRVNQDADAREVVQEVLISVSAAIKNFDVDAPGSFRGWLSRITRNAAIDRLRVSLRNRNLNVSDLGNRLDQLATEDESRQLEAEFETHRRQQLFRWAAAEVRRRTGEVNWIAFWRTSVEGEAVATVSGDLGISPGAVYVAKCRVLKRIRRLVHERLSE